MIIPKCLAVNFDKSRYCVVLVTAQYFFTLVLSRLLRFLTLTPARMLNFSILTLGNEKKNKFIFCISLVFRNFADFFKKATTKYFKYYEQKITLFIIDAAIGGV